MVDEAILDELVRLMTEANAWYNKLYPANINPPAWLNRARELLELSDSATSEE